MKKTYLDFVNEIFGSKEATLKELFSTLFLEIHKSFPQDVQVYDIQLIDELKTTWADQQDFNQTLRRFTWKHYSDDRIATILNKNSKFRFSILDLRPIFDRREMKSSQSFSRIKNAYEKGYRIISFEEYATIAEHLIFWRNKAAHRGGIRNVSQALAIYSEISLLIKIYPDNLKSKIFGLDDYQTFLEKDFLESVMLSADFDFQSEPSSPIELPETEDNLDEAIIANLELETLKDSVDDLAKLNHALLVSGSIVRSNKFSFDIVDNDIDIHYLIKSNLLEFKILLESFIEKEGYNKYKIDIITSLIYLNIAPLYNGDYSKFLFSLGNLNLQRLINKNS